MKHPVQPHRLSLHLRAALAFAVSTATFAAAATSAETADETVTLDRLEVSSARASTYSTETASAATRLTLSPRETPQSLTIITPQRIEDQNLRSLTDLVEASTGLSSLTYDSERVTYYSRGFEINRYLYDGVPSAASYGSYGDIKQDTFVFERVEIVRGATGLLTGPGNPSASINLVRKHADSKVLTGSLSVSAGSWDDYRTALDVSTPLSANGAVHGRFVSVYESADSFLDRYLSEKKVFYGVIDADLGQHTTLTTGFDYQRVTPNGVTWGSLPLRFADGSLTDFDRSLSTSAKWTYWDTTIQTAFAGLTHTFANGWKFNAVYSHVERDYDSILLYQYGYPDKATGSGMAAGAGHYIGDNRQNSLDAYASGPFTLFGRKHELVVGTSLREDKNKELGAGLAYVPVENLYSWDGTSAQPVIGDYAANYGDTVTRQTGTYAAARLSLADPLSLIAGGRFSTWKNTGGADTYEYEEFTPYAGLVYRFNATYSAYASYTDIFSPQTAKDVEERLVDPIIGSNLEAGLKAEFFQRRLNVSAAVFRTKQDNYYETDYSTILSDGSYPVYTTGPITSEGFEAELSGEVTKNWNLSLGFTHYTLEDDTGAAVGTTQPRTSVKVFTSYRLPGAWQRLTVGGGVNWQSKSYSDVTGPLGNTVRNQQDAYALVALFARCQLTKSLSGQLNVENLFDKKYYAQSGFGDVGQYGTPRRLTATIKYSF